MKKKQHIYQATIRHDAFITRTSRQIFVVTRNYSMAEATQKVNAVLKTRESDFPNSTIEQIQHLGEIENS